MESSGAARVLVVAHKTAATPALIAAVRERAQAGPAAFTLLVPNAAHGLHRVVDAEDVDRSEAEQILALAIPLLEEAARGHVEGIVGDANPMDAVALDAAARVGSCTAQTTVQVTFHEYATTDWGQNVFVVGSIPALGNWDPNAALPLSSATYPVWRGTANLPAGASIQYKYLKKNGSQVIWESDPNRTRTTASSAPCAATWSDTWR